VYRVVQWYTVYLLYCEKSTSVNANVSSRSCSLQKAEARGARGGTEQVRRRRAGSNSGALACGQTRCSRAVYVFSSCAAASRAPRRGSVQKVTCTCAHEASLSRQCCWDDAQGSCARADAIVNLGARAVVLAGCRLQPPWARLAKQRQAPTPPHLADDAASSSCPPAREAEQLRAHPHAC